MKKTFAKTIAMILVLMLTFSAALACVAFAEDESAVEAPANLKARDIYLVLDTSASMKGVPMENLKEAAKQFCAVMLNDKTAANRIAIITYGSSVETYNYSTDYAELANNIDAISASGSTPMYDALMAVKDLDEKLGNGKATKHVVVMADGLPNEGATLQTGKYTAKDSSTFYKYGNAVYSTAAGMWYDYKIYSVGFFHSLAGTQLKYGKTLMKDIQNALYLEVFDPDKIKDAFDGIANDIINPSESTTAPVTTTTAPVTTTAPITKPNGGDKIPQTSDGSVAIAAAAVVLAAGIAVFAVKKKED